MTRKTYNGFTLVEVMVALAVVGVALPALLFQVQSQTGHTTVLRERTYAQWIAQNKMTEIRLLKRIKGEIPKGKNQGEVEMADFKWYWEVSTEKTPMADKFQRVTISIATEQNQEQALLAYEGIMSE